MFKFQVPTPKGGWDMEWQLIGWRIRRRIEEDQRNQYPPVGNGEANNININTTIKNMLPFLFHGIVLSVFL